MIAIVDYKIGNIGAVANMLGRIGAAAKITSDPSEIEAATKIILPGNGAFDSCMRNLRATGLIPLLAEKILRDKIPVLGICVGAQMLGHGSEEGAEPGLGWINLNVRRLPQIEGLRVPHMGWSEVRRTKPENYLVRDMDSDTRFYFVHSYYMQPVNKNDTLLIASYGLDFAAAVSHENISGVQFHPEKSHRFGKKLLANFAAGDR